LLLFLIARKFKKIILKMSSSFKILALEFISSSKYLKKKIGFWIKKKHFEISQKRFHQLHAFSFKKSNIHILRSNTYLICAFYSFSQ